MWAVLGSLTNGRRVGSFREMARRRLVHVRRLGCRMEGSDFDYAMATTVEYDDSEPIVEREALPCD